MDKEVKERKEEIGKELAQLNQQLVQAENAVKQLPIMIAFRQGALEELNRDKAEGDEEIKEE